VARIVLTGFMATGKTVVGRRLAAALSRPFVDTDSLVEAKAGCRVSALFAAEGEGAFRKRERQAVEEACRVPDAVVATGGGTLIDPDSRRLLTTDGVVVCLTADPATILERLGDPATRPLIGRNGNSGDRLMRIRALVAERAPLYALAPHTVDTTKLTVDEVVERVRALVAGR
jgi:shikimate kinase